MHTFPAFQLVMRGQGEKRLRCFLPGRTDALFSGGEPVSSHDVVDAGFTDLYAVVLQQIADFPWSVLRMISDVGKDLILRFLGCDVGRGQVQSIAGTEKTNDNFGVTKKLIHEAYQVGTGSAAA